jgi:hypothetical protein
MILVLNYLVPTPGADNRVRVESKNIEMYGPLSTGGTRIIFPSGRAIEVEQTPLQLDAALDAIIVY